MNTVYTSTKEYKSMSASKALKTRLAFEGTEEGGKVIVGTHGKVAGGVAKSLGPALAAVGAAVSIYDLCTDRNEKCSSCKAETNSQPCRFQCIECTIMRGEPVIIEYNNYASDWLYCG